MDPTTVCVLQHVACEPPGRIADALVAADLGVVTVRPYLGEPVPVSLESYAGLVVMGGPMGVYEQDRYRFLADEVRLIQSAVAAGKPVLGVCLGSQLLAAALGASVTRAPRKELGWFPVTLTPEAHNTSPWRHVTSPFTALHWHGDVFALPAGAVPWAASELTPHQAFAFGRTAWGLLFHLEVTEAMVEHMAATFGDELRQAGVEGRQLLEQTRRFLPELEVIARRVFGAWAEWVRAACVGGPGATPTGTTPDLL